MPADEGASVQAPSQAPSARDAGLKPRRYEDANAGASSSKITLDDLREDMVHDLEEQTR